MASRPDQTLDYETPTPQHVSCRGTMFAFAFGWLLSILPAISVSDVIDVAASGHHQDTGVVFIDLMIASVCLAIGLPASAILRTRFSRYFGTATACFFGLLFAPCVVGGVFGVLSLA